MELISPTTLRDVRLELARIEELIDELGDDEPAARDALANGLEKWGAFESMDEDDSGLATAFLIGLSALRHGARDAFVDLRDRHQCWDTLPLTDWDHKDAGDLELAAMAGVGTRALIIRALVVAVVLVVVGIPVLRVMWAMMTHGP